MNLYEREFFVYRISSGYLRFNDLRIVNPNIDILYESQEVYLNTLSESIEFECLSSDEMLSFLIDKELWSEYESKQLDDVLPKHLEYWKVELYTNFDNKKERERIREYLNKCRETLNSLFIKRHLFDCYTQHGLATFAKHQFIIENTTYKGKKKYDFSEFTINHILEHINKSHISESVIRELSRTDPWYSIWKTPKIGRMFKCIPSEMSEEQKRLLSWSHLYENISNYEDCPSIEVIEDNDALDGWLISKNREQKKNKDKKAFDNKYGHHGDGETFVIVDSQQSAQKIYEMNDPTSRGIVQQRLNTVKEYGTAKETDFMDVQRKLNMQINAMRSSKR